MSAAKTLNPEVLWAQRSSESDAEENYLLITISVPDCENPSVKIEPSYLEFTAKSKGHVGDEASHEYHLHIDFYKEIVPDKTLHKIANGQHYFLKVFKKDLGLEYWPRLTKEKVKVPYIKTDFNKWVDEDEQQDVPAPAGFDMNDMLMNGNPDMEALKQQLAQGGGGLDLGAEGFPEELDDEADEEEVLEQEAEPSK